MHRDGGAPALTEASGCFCTLGAMQGYDVICLFSRWQKPVAVPKAIGYTACYKLGPNTLTFLVSGFIRYNNTIVIKLILNTFE